MSDAEFNELEWAGDEMTALAGRQRCCALATVASDGAPLSSYAPVYIDDAFRFHVYVSAMAKHFGHLRRDGRASVALIEDEATAENLFARKRLTVDCSAQLIERGSPEWVAIMAKMEARLGSTIGYLKELADFGLYRLTPSEGRLVLGFGKAYRVWGDGLSEIGYVGAGGHRPVK